MPIRKERIDNLDSNGQSLKGIDCTVDQERVFVVSSSAAVALQFNLVSQSGSGTNSQWTVQISLDGVTWGDVKSGIVTVTLANAAQITETIDTTSIMHVRVYNNAKSTFTTETCDIILTRVDW